MAFVILGGNRCAVIDRAGNTIIEDYYWNEDDAIFPLAPYFSDGLCPIFIPDEQPKNEGSCQ